MDFTEFLFHKDYNRNWMQIRLYFDFDLSTFTNHKKSSFTGYESLLTFALSNTGKQLYLTLDWCEDFQEDWNNLVLNLREYIRYSESIWKNWENRAQAFFSRKVRHFNDDERRGIIASSEDEEILYWIWNLSQEKKIEFISKMQQIDWMGFENRTTLTDSEFGTHLLDALNNPQKLERISENYSTIQIGLLETYLRFIKETIEKVRLDDTNTDAWETYIQKWIDAKLDHEWNEMTISDDKKIKESNSRALIFWLEYTKHKREVLDSWQRMDVLAKLDNSSWAKEYVLIELKSPKADIFEDEESELKISKKLARAIPQVLDYKSDFETKQDWDRDLDRRNLVAWKIIKCIIVIWLAKENQRWQKIFSQLKWNFSGMIEIWTYSDLVRKLETTIENLKSNF